MKIFCLCASLFSLFILLFMALLYINVQDSHVMAVLLTLTGPGLGFAIHSVVKDFRGGIW